MIQRFLAAMVAMLGLADASRVARHSDVRQWEADTAAAIAYAACLPVAQPEPPAPKPDPDGDAGKPVKPTAKPKPTQTSQKATSNACADGACPVPSATKTTTPARTYYVPAQPRVRIFRWRR